MSGAEPIRIAWWPGGFSLGFMEVLRETAQCELHGLLPQFLPQVTPEAALRAAAEETADVVVGASALHAVQLARSGAALRVVQASQLGHSVFLGRSSYRDFASLRGGRIGLAPPRTTNHALAALMLERNHGLALGTYALRCGSEAELLRMLAEGDLDAVSVRALAVPPMPLLSDFAWEWQRLTGLPGRPVLGVIAAAAAFTAAHPAALATFLNATAATVAVGCADAARVAHVLHRRLGIDISDAEEMAAQWARIYVARLDSEAVAALDRLHALLTPEATIAAAPGAAYWWPQATAGAGWHRQHRRPGIEGSR